MLVRMCRKGNPLALFVGVQAGAATLENCVEVPQELKIDLPYDSELHCWGFTPKIQMQ